MTTPIPTTAWVCFSGEADIWWLRFLRPGFRHCFAVAQQDKNWIVIDPLSPYLELDVLPLAATFDLPAWLAGQNLTVVRTTIRRNRTRPAPANIFSCVEVVKRFLGIHARAVFTPWQLYTYLTKEASHG